MERETKTIETPISKHKVEIKTYLTGREKRALSDIYIKTGVEYNQETQQVKGLNAELINEAQNKGWETVVVSINGSTEDIINTILDMREEDFMFVVKEVDTITTGADFEKKNLI